MTPVQPTLAQPTLARAREKCTSHRQITVARWPKSRARSQRRVAAHSSLRAPPAIRCPLQIATGPQLCAARCAQAAPKLLLLLPRAPKPQASTTRRVCARRRDRSFVSVSCVLSAVTKQCCPSATFGSDGRAAVTVAQSTCCHLTTALRAPPHRSPFKGPAVSDCRSAALSCPRHSLERRLALLLCRAPVVDLQCCHCPSIGPAVVSSASQKHTTSARCHAA